MCLGLENYYTIKGVMMRFLTDIRGITLALSHECRFLHTVAASCFHFIPKDAIFQQFCFM